MPDRADNGRQMLQMVYTDGRAIRVRHRAGGCIPPS